MPADHEEMERSVAGYVLGALDADEARAVEEHLKACAECRAVAARLAGVVAVVPLATAAAAPPDRLRGRILAAAASGRRAESPAPQIRRLPRRQERAFGWRVPAWAAVALVAAIAAFALGSGLGIQLGRGSAPPASTSESALAGSGRLSSAQAKVIALRSDAILLVDFSQMPQPSAGRVYELWVIRPGAAPVPAAVFVPEPDGTKLLVLQRTFQGKAVLAVTTEPGPAGSPAPTEQPSMAGTVA